MFRLLANGLIGNKTSENSDKENFVEEPCDLNSEEQVRLKAYYLWESAGRPEGQELDFWSKAEQEINNGQS